MNVFIVDTDTIGETSATVFESLQQSPVDSTFIFRNTSDENNIYYRFQQYTGTEWEDLLFDGNLWNEDDGDSGNDTLTPEEIKTFKVSSGYPKIKVVASTTPSGSGNGGGVADLEFSCSRFFNRPSGGNIPLLSF